MPTAKWPDVLQPPVQYRTCWRCGTDCSPGPKPRLCRDCLSIVRSEPAVWREEPRPRRPFRKRTHSPHADTLSV